MQDCLRSQNHTENNQFVEMKVTQVEASLSWCALYAECNCTSWYRHLSDQWNATIFLSTIITFDRLRLSASVSLQIRVKQSSFYENKTEETFDNGPMMSQCWHNRTFAGNSEEFAGFHTMPLLISQSSLLAYLFSLLRFWVLFEELQVHWLFTGITALKNTVFSLIVLTFLVISPPPLSGENQCSLV